MLDDGPAKNVRNILYTYTKRGDDLTVETRLLLICKDDSPKGIDTLIIVAFGVLYQRIVAILVEILFSSVEPGRLSICNTNRWLEGLKRSLEPLDSIFQSLKVASKTSATALRKLPLNRLFAYNHIGGASCARVSTIVSHLDTG